jgi:hypothetical protein
MSRIVIVILIYHRHKPIDINYKGNCLNKKKGSGSLSAPINAFTETNQLNNLGKCINYWFNHCRLVLNHRSLNGSDSSTLIT